MKVEHSTYSSAFEPEVAAYKYFSIKSNACADRSLIIDLLTYTFYIV